MKGQLPKNIIRFMTIMTRFTTLRVRESGIVLDIWLKIEKKTFGPRSQIQKKSSDVDPDSDPVRIQVNKITKLISKH